MVLCHVVYIQDFIPMWTNSYWGSKLNPKRNELVPQKYTGLQPFASCWPESFPRKLLGSNFSLWKPRDGHKPSAACCMDQDKSFATCRWAASFTCRSAAMVFGRVKRSDLPMFFHDWKIPKHMHCNCMLHRCFLLLQASSWEDHQWEFVVPNLAWKWFQWKKHNFSLSFSKDFRATCVWQNMNCCWVRTLPMAIPLLMDHTTYSAFVKNSTPSTWKDAGISPGYPNSQTPNLMGYEIGFSLMDAFGQMCNQNNKVNWDTDSPCQHLDCSEQGAPTTLPFPEGVSRSPTTLDAHNLQAWTCSTVGRGKPNMAQPNPFLS